MAQLTAFFSLETMETRRSQNNTVIKTEKKLQSKNFISDKTII